MNEVAKWADEAMFRAAPLTMYGEPVTPTVHLIHMTANPLRVIAAASQMYKGDPVLSPDDVPRKMAEQALKDAADNKLQAPLEFVDLHFLFEGVSRAFTQQLERQRTAVYVQESLRFAVKDNVAAEVVMPPSFAELPEDDPIRRSWVDHVTKTGWLYNMWVNNGIPAEDARAGLLMNTATRVHYKTNLRGLRDHSGMRLCTQAQHEWKEVWIKIIQAIIGYGPEGERWQQRLITSLFKPVCYQTGSCPFHASTDRYCVIRDRVDAHAARGDHPDTWSDIDPIVTLHPEAARRAR